jgi:predicted MFS family arabinose efflux permease
VSELRPTSGARVCVDVQESPAFTHARDTHALARFPLAELLRSHPRELVLGTLAVTASPAVGLLLYVYLIPYGQQVLHLPVTTMLILAGISGIALILGIRISALVSEDLGVRRISVCGLLALAAWAIPFFLLFDTGSLPAAVIAFAVFGFTVGVVNGPQATLLAELYPVRVRYSGASLALQLAGVLGGVIAPVASTALLAATGNGLFIGIWVIVISLISLTSVIYLRIGSGVDASEREPGSELASAA